MKPAFEEFCQPTKKYADVIIPRGGENDVAIDLLVQHIQVGLVKLALWALIRHLLHRSGNGKKMLQNTFLGSFENSPWQS